MWEYVYYKSLYEQVESKYTKYSFLHMTGSEMSETITVKIRGL